MDKGMKSRQERDIYNCCQTKEFQEWGDTRMLIAEFDKTYYLERPYCTYITPQFSGRELYCPFLDQELEVRQGDGPLFHYVRFNQCTNTKRAKPRFRI